MTAPRDPSIPPELDRSLDDAPDGEALRAIWRALPGAQPAADATPERETQRDAAWARLRARLDDPARVPTKDDDVPGIRLVREGVVPRGATHEVPHEVPRDAARVARPGARKSSASFVTRARWVAAAALVLLAGAGTAWRLRPEHLAVAEGGRPRHFLLADGSRLVLAPGSSARMARDFRGLWRPSAERTVRLEGEAFFTVARDGRAFVVETRDATVRVLGTRFDVRAVAGEGTRVLVESGRVAVAARGSTAAAPLELGAGDATLVQGEATPRVLALPVARLTSWRAGGLAALDEPLGAVLAELQRRFGVRIAVEGTIETAARVSLFYPAVPAVESVLADLCTMQGLSYRRTSEGYVIAAGTTRP